MCSRTSLSSLQIEYDLGNEMNLNNVNQASMKRGDDHNVNKCEWEETFSPHKLHNLKQHYLWRRRKQRVC